MNLHKLLIISLIFLVTLSIGCSKNPVIETETQSETLDCRITPPTAGTPINFWANPVTSNQVWLSWRALSPATTYKIYRDNQFLIETSDAMYFDNFNFAQKTPYQYKVVAASTSGSSRNSSVSYFSGILSNSNPLDIHNITLTEDSWINMVVTISGTLNMYASDEKTILLTDAASGNIIYSTHGSNQTTNFGGSAYFPLKAGSYSIKLKRISGEGSYTIKGYTIGSQFINDSEPNNTFENSIVLPLNSTHTGHLGFTGEDNILDAADFYRISLDKKTTLGLSLSIDGSLCLAGNTLRGVTIYKNDRVTIAEEINGPGGGEDISSSKNISLAAGTYYLKLSRINGYGGYTLKVCGN